MTGRAPKTRTQMTTLKTQPGQGDLENHLASLPSETRQQEAATLLKLYRDTTGFPPVLWGKDIIGFGRYDYTYPSGRSGSWFATGFAARRAALSFYVLPGYQDYDTQLLRLGKHKRGKSCIVVKSLRDIDQMVLSEILGTGLRDLARLWPVYSE